jgi:hypothetical protein
MSMVGGMASLDESLSAGHKTSSSQLTWIHIVSSSQAETETPRRHQLNPATKRADDLLVMPLATPETTPIGLVRISS